MGARKSRQDDSEVQEPASLVPMYGGQDIARGIQAYRRGDAIVYTVRGEPSLVLELMGELGKHGVSEVVALIAHPSGEEVEEEPQHEGEDTRDPDGG